MRLIEAMARGVRVRIITNEREAAIRGGGIRLAAFPTLIRLVEGGAEVWAWKANPKLLRRGRRHRVCRRRSCRRSPCTGRWFGSIDELTIVHSSNFNIRSTYYNTEAGVAVLNPGFNPRMKRLLDGLLDLHNFDLQLHQRRPAGRRRPTGDPARSRRRQGHAAANSARSSGSSTA